MRRKKSIDSVAGNFCRQFKGEIENILAPNKRPNYPTLLYNLKRIVGAGVADAYFEGLRMAGVMPEDYEDSDYQTVDDLTAEQFGFLTDFVLAVQDARGNADTERALMARAGLWCDTIKRIGENAYNTATDGLFEFVLDGPESEESCETCQKMLGKKHRWSWIVKNGYELTIGNDKYECGVFNCPHKWKPVKKNG